MRLKYYLTLNQKKETSAMCNGDKSEELFKKSGFLNFGANSNNLQIYRFP